MEPLSALGIAAAAVQFVDFTARLFSDTVTLYRSASGQTQEQVFLSTIIRDLDSLTSSVESKASRLPQNPAPGTTDDVFLRLCRQCKEVSADLAGVLQKLPATTRSQPTKYDLIKSAFFTVIKSYLSKEKVQTLKVTLEEIKREVQLTAIVSLWEKAHDQGETLAQIMAQQIHITDELRKDIEGRAKILDQKLTQAPGQITDTRRRTLERAQLGEEEWYQSLVGRIASLTSSGADDLATLLRDRWLQGWLPEPIQASLLQITSGGHSQQIIDSLAHQYMDDRGEAIPKAYADTFSWLFRARDDSASAVNPAPPWSCFPTWLSSSTKEIYWVTGKAGSGKSTLMKFILSHKELDSNLSVFAGNTPLLKASFYFWNSGTELQKSQEGLMRSLLHQLLLQKPELVRQVCKRRWAALEILKDAPVSLPKWSMTELTESLSLLAKGSGKDYKMALFIDGLDEYIGDHSRLVDFMKQLSVSDGVKVCISSRPWNVFGDHFKTNPKLRTHDLTRKDIEKYVHGHFDPLVSFEEMKRANPAGAQLLVDTIVGKADGVFLWISLVVMNLIKRLNDGDRLQELLYIVKSLPNDLENLFESIKQHIDPGYFGHASQYFQLRHAAWKADLPISAIAMKLVDEKDSDPIHQDLKGITEIQRCGMIDIMRRRLNSRTMGLLEISGKGVVDYLHRTVQDWITQPDNWTKIRDEGPPDYDANLQLFAAEVALLTDPFSWGDKQGSRENPEARERIGGCLKYAEMVGDRPDRKKRLLELWQRLDENASHLMGADWPCRIVRRKKPHDRSTLMVELSARYGVFPYFAEHVVNLAPDLLDEHWKCMLCDLAFADTVLGDSHNSVWVAHCASVCSDFDHWTQRRLEMIKLILNITAPGSQSVNLSDLEWEIFIDRAPSRSVEKYWSAIKRLLEDHIVQHSTR
ncbi:hypothetical protein QBC40DRAFT_300613 [Triangularia verruculosa]|uniref:NACHT domain-containing protein n=1 Tax=Triangularia verruculosa TaxID=2587418 RepID=A0AAN6X8Z2_9PEZI|nr:hypothetical protein QBC40DRAFT_300613 [Triangularia verruculosa]